MAACVAGTWDEQALFEAFRRAWPYRDLARGEFDEVVALHTQGRRAVLHRDGVNGRARTHQRIHEGGARQRRLEPGPAGIRDGDTFAGCGDRPLAVAAREAGVGEEREHLAVPVEPRSPLARSRAEDQLASRFGGATGAPPAARVAATFRRRRRASK